jgi:hypothetical protein
MKESNDNTSYTNYQKDGPSLKVVQQAQQEMVQGSEAVRGVKPRPTPYDKPAITVRPPKPGKPYNV